MRVHLTVTLEVPTDGAEVIRLGDLMVDSTRRAVEHALNEAQASNSIPLLISVAEDSRAKELRTARQRALPRPKCWCGDVLHHTQPSRKSARKRI